MRQRDGSLAVESNVNLMTNLKKAATIDALAAA
jgi:hypothetical protein